MFIKDEYYILTMEFTTAKKPMNNNSMAKKTKQTIKYTNFDISKVVLPALEDNRLNTAQKISVPKYKQDQYYDSLVQIQTHLINMFTYGIPKPGAYYKDDAARSFVKIPENVNDPASVEFFKKMESIDEYLTSPEGKKKLFSSEKVANNYVYQPIVRTPEELDEFDEELDEETRAKIAKQKEAGPKPRYIKLKIDLDWETKNIKSKVLVTNEEKKRVPVEDVVTLDDFNKYVRYKSNSTFVIMWNKVYASKNKLGDSKKYGAGFKIVQALCEEPRDSNYENVEDAFIDDEEVSNIMLSNVTISASNESVDLGSNKININLANDVKHLDDEQETDEQSDEEENDDEENDEADTVVTQAQAVVTKTVTPVVQKSATSKQRTSSSSSSTRSGKKTVTANQA